jgi:hypothetical protein
MLYWNRRLGFSQVKASAEMEFAKASDAYSASRSVLLFLNELISKQNNNISYILISASVKILFGSWTGWDATWWNAMQSTEYWVSEWVLN